MTAEYIKHFPELFNIKTTGSTAFLYAGGPASHHSDIRNIKDLSDKGTIVVKGQIGFNAYNVARKFDNVDYVNINANTCASGMHCVYEAYNLLKDGYKNVIIYAEDMVEQTQLLLFKQLGINISCGDGVAMLHFTSERTDNTKACIYDVAWKWNCDKSPMSVSADGYVKLLNELNTTDVDLVKPHGTGTTRNDIEEDSVIAELFSTTEVVKFKPEIGHTQGVSALVELCMLVDRYAGRNVVCLASGLGGFYGGCCINI